MKIPGVKARKGRRTILGVLCGAFVLAFSSSLLLGYFLPTGAQPPHAAEDRYVRLFDRQIRYRIADHGGPAVILLHPFGGNLDMWEPIVRHLTYGRIISLDLIGFGLSDRHGTDFTLETQRRYLLAFMDALHVDSAMLVGSSMGASLAAWTAARSPERVDSVVLFAPSGYPGSMHARWPGAWFYRPGFLNWLADRIVSTWMFERMFPRSLARQTLEATSSYGPEFADALGKIAQPVVLVWSTGDQRVPFRYSHVYRKTIPQASFIAAPAEAGHGAAFYDPGETARIVGGLLNRRGRGG